MHTYLLVFGLLILSLMIPAMSACSATRVSAGGLGAIPNPAVDAPLATTRASKRSAGRRLFLGC